MRDAISMSIDHLKEKAKRDKKVILVVTDGNDNASKMSLEALVRLAQQDDVLIYAIGLLSEEEKREAQQGQARAADCWWRAPAARSSIRRTSPKWSSIAHEVAHDIRNQYTIAYTPSNTALDGDVPADQGGGEGSGKPGGAHPERLLRNKGPAEDPPESPPDP